MSQGLLLKALAKRYAAWIWGAAAAIIIAGGAGAMLDIRWLILALMLLFVLIPCLAALLYLSAATRPVAAANTLPHFIDFGTDALRLMVLPRVEPTESDSDEQEPAEAEAAPPVPMAVSYADAKGYAVSDSSLTITLTNHQFIWIPYYAFRDQTHLIEATTFIRTKISCSEQ